MINLASEIPLRALVPQELAHVMLTHFGQAESATPFVYLYRRANQSFCVTLTYHANGSIRSVEATDDFPPEEVEALRDVVTAQLIADQQPVADWNVLFSTYRSVQGYFQYRDRFQIRPLPATAPMVPFVAAQHPFALYFVHPRSAAGMIHQMRRLRETVQIGRYLNLLLDSGIHSGPKSTRFDWVMDASDAAHLTSRWTQLGYVPGAVPELTLPLQPPADVDPLIRVNVDAYYQNPFAHPVYELAVPENLEASLDRIYGLNAEARSQLEIAITWLSQVSGLWTASLSASYAALVIGIEALLEKQPPQICECCGQERHSTTRRFTEFLTMYAPGLETNPRLKSRLYKVRSEIVHGKELLEWDREPWHFFSGAQGDDERQLYDNAFWIVRSAIYNWLWADRSAAQESSLHSQPQPRGSDA